MANMQQILRGYVNLKRDKLLALAKISLYNLYPVCRAADGNGIACSTIAAAVLSVINMDGKVDDKEKTFLQDLLNNDEKDTETLLGFYTKDMPDRTREFAKSLNGEMKVEIGRLALCLAAADENLSREEAFFVLDLIS